MIKQHVIVVFGLPGAGKTTLINSVLNDNPAYVRLSGGSLITAELLEADRDILRKAGAGEVLSNQEILVHNFKKRKSLETRNILFDGHCVVKDQDKVVQIPLDVIRRLTPNHIIFVDANTEEIISRRQKDKSRPDREVETAEQIDKNRELQLSICKSYTHELGIPLTVLESADKDILNKLLKKYGAGGGT